MLACVFDDVGHDPHARLGRIDVGVAHHELFEDVVLDGARQRLKSHALFLASHDVTGHDRQYGTVHRHRHAHLVERYAVEEDQHVLDRIDGHASLADVADDSRVIAVVAAMRCEVERDRQPHLAPGQVGSIERVGFFGSGEPGVLANRPGAVRVHGGPRPPHERRHAGDPAQMSETVEVVFGVERLHIDAFGGRHRQLVERSPAKLLLGQFAPLGFGHGPMSSRPASIVTSLGVNEFNMASERVREVFEVVVVGGHDVVPVDGEQCDSSVDDVGELGFGEQLPSESANGLIDRSHLDACKRCGESGLAWASSPRLAEYSGVRDREFAFGERGLESDPHRSFVSFER